MNRSIYRIDIAYYGILVVEYEAIECPKIIKAFRGGSERTTQVSRIPRSQINQPLKDGGLHIWAFKEDVRPAIERVRKLASEKLTEEIAELQQARSCALHGEARFDANYNAEEIAKKTGPVTDDMF